VRVNPFEMNELMVEDMAFFGYFQQKVWFSDSG
jgi:hypothetical protein